MKINLTYPAFLAATYVVMRHIEMPVWSAALCALVFTLTLWDGKTKEEES